MSRGFPSNPPSDHLGLFHRRRLEASRTPNGRSSKGHSPRPEGVFPAGQGPQRGSESHHLRSTTASTRCGSTRRNSSFAERPTNFAKFTTFTKSTEFARRTEPLNVSPFHWLRVASRLP